MQKNKILFLIVWSIALVGCQSAEDELKESIKAALKDNAGINQTEYENFKEIIEMDPKLQATYSDDKLYSLIDGLAAKMAKRKTNPITYPLVTLFKPVAGGGADSTAATTPSKASGNSFNVYLENSASMDGYIQGDTEFEAALFKLLTNINGYNEDCKLHYINKDTFSVNRKIDDFMKYIDDWKSIGDRTDSKLNAIFNKTIDIYLKDQKPIILVSDYIYSLKEGNAIKELNVEKYSTLTVFQKISKETSVLIIQNSSAFNGVYYTLENKRFELKNQQRPYYIWVIGTNAMIADFVKKYRVEDLKGYKNYCIITSNEVKTPPYNALLTKTLKKGAFRSCRDGGGAGICMESIEFNDRGEKVLEFSVAVDLSKTGLSDAYKNDVKNYVMSSPKNDSLAVVAVHPTNNIHASDQRFKGSATHILVVRTAKLSLGNQTVQLKLKKQLPDWVAASSTEDDRSIIIKDSTAILINKTFGLNHLVTGVYEAYAPEKFNYFFEIPIIINK